jgi:hypothetical protein
MIDHGLTRPNWCKTTNIAFVVVVTIHTPTGSICSTESMTNTIRDAEQTKKAILQNKWMLGAEVLWYQENNYLESVDIFAVCML